LRAALANICARRVDQDHEGRAFAPPRIDGDHAMKKSLLSGAAILAIAVLMSGCVAQNGGGNMNSANNPPQQNPPQDPNQPDPQDPNQPDPQDQGNGNGGGGIQLNPDLVGKLQPQPQPKPGINPGNVPILVEKNPGINLGGPVMISQQPANGLNPVKVKPGKVNIGQQNVGQVKPGKVNGGLNKKPILIQP
jgi:hypothetical protein